MSVRLGNTHFGYCCAELFPLQSISDAEVTLPGHKAGSLVYDVPDLWGRVNNPHHWLGRGRILL